MAVSLFENVVFRMGFRRRFFRTPLFVGRSDRRRRSAIFKAFADADTHGLPVARYNPDELMALMKQAKTAQDIGRVEVEATDVATEPAVRAGVLRLRRGGEERQQEEEDADDSTLFV